MSGSQLVPSQKNPNPKSLTESMIFKVWYGCIVAIAAIDMANFAMSPVHSVLKVRINFVPGLLDRVLLLK